MAALNFNSHLPQKRPAGGLLPTPIFNPSEGCFYPLSNSVDNSHIRINRKTKRVCPRCIHGLIVLGTQLYNLPPPTEISVSELSADNLLSTLYTDEDQAADFRLVLEKYGLNPHQLTHFSRECPLKSSNNMMQLFSITCRIPLQQLLSYKRDVLKQMRKNKTCIRCGRAYFGTHLPIFAEHGRCSFWDSENSAFISSSRFISTSTANISP